MDFSFSADQQDLRAAVRDVIEDLATPQRRQAVIDDEQAYDAKLWSLVAGELGLAGIAVSEANGGTGGGFVEAAVVLEELGAALVAVPLLTGIVAAATLDRAGRPVEVLSAIAGGQRSAAIVAGDAVAVDDEGLSGTVRHVIDGHHADVLVVAAPDGLYVVDAASDGVTVTGAPSLDLTRWQSTVELAGARAEPVGDAAAAASAVDLLRVAIAVESVGAARRCVTSTADYLKTRVQFGKPIGSFQALQHRMADLVVDLEAATSTAYYAAWAAAASPAELPVVAPLAKAVCTDAAYRIAAETIQLHGGIGFTWEHDAHLYFKRATANRLLLGDSHRQRALVAERAGLG